MPARAIVEMQDRKIGEMSGMPRGRIKTITRSRKVKARNSTRFGAET
jgi:hypothetical protein